MSSNRVGPSGFDGRPLRERFGFVAGYPGKGVWHTTKDVDVDGLPDLIVENEYCQAILLGAYPGISAYKSKLNPACPYFEMLEPESGAVGKLRGAVIGEEMYYCQEATEGEWDGTMDYSGKVDRYPWWDAIFKLYTPSRLVEETRRLSFKVTRYGDLLHVVESAYFSPLYEPIQEIEYHYLFAAGDPAIYWYNLRRFGAVDAPIGSTTRVGRMNLAGKVPVGWALPCNKVDCYDSYYWNRELSGPCPGDPWKLYIEHTDPEMPWLEVFTHPPENLMFYYDSRGTYGGSGAVVLPGWIAMLPHVRCSMSRQYRGWWRVDDLTRDDLVRPNQETHGGLCACIVAGPVDPLGEAKNIASNLVDTTVLDVPREVQSSTVLRKRGKELLLYAINPGTARRSTIVRFARLESAGLEARSSYRIDRCAPETGRWDTLARLSGRELVDKGFELAVEPKTAASVSIRPA